MFNNQFQSLSSINGVEDISQENAAACSGGRIILYDERNQRGVSVSFPGGSVANLASFGFNNKASSIEVTNAQTWRLWTNVNFGGNSINYGQGNFNLFGVFNDSISSLSRVR
ncbi:MAG: peptidase inhibitor family I36 protein [Desmonostoc geniculatum HA4340-LM1]|nr:peptidase inhibitor family I36 protein [Desmonostoc geniculatum HA4340-LM1]